MKKKNNLQTMLFVLILMLVFVFALINQPLFGLVSIIILSIIYTMTSTNQYDELMHIII